MSKHSTKLKLTSILAGAMMAGCVAGEYNYPSSMSFDADTSARHPYSMSTSSDVARIGETSQRFEIRDGDCRGTDCSSDRRRVELTALGSLNHVPGDDVWYGWSIYIPNDFQDISPAGTIFGQAKLVGWNGENRGPLWDFTLQRGRLIFKYSPMGRADPIDCPTVSLAAMRGRWTDIVVNANYDYENEDNSPTIRTWINGRLMCSGRLPLVTPFMTRTAGRNNIYMRYGIYNSRLSRWQSTYGTTIPTQVVHYDEVRIGDSREEVDVRMQHTN